MLQVKDHGENSDMDSNSCTDILLALGSNQTSTLGTAAETLQIVIKKLSQNGGLIRSVSPLYSTPAFPPGAGPDFVNAAARISAPWSAPEMLRICHEIEAEAGRVRRRRWEARALDIDLLAIGDQVLPNPKVQAFWRNLPLKAQMTETPAELILPHPRLQDRAFVLVPLADVAPDWRHPLLGCTVLQMRDALDPAALEEVKRLE